jgi:hypothetical protein
LAISPSSWQRVTDAVRSWGLGKWRVVLIVCVCGG